MSHTKQKIFPASGAVAFILMIASLKFELKDRFASFLIACSTYAMGRFAGAHVWLQNVSERSASEIGQLIPLLLCIPCFKLSHACFKIAYFLGHRRLASLGRKCALLGGNDLSLQFDERIAKFGSVPELYQFLRGLACRFERISDRIDLASH